MFNVFYLTSSDNYTLVDVRRCVALAKVKFEEQLGREGLLLRVEPPVHAEYGPIAGSEVEHVVVVARHLGHSVTHVTSWPVYVYVLVPKCDDSLEQIRRGMRQKFDDFVNQWWGDLYNNKKQADKAAKTMVEAQKIYGEPRERQNAISHREGPSLDT